MKKFNKEKVLNFLRIFDFNNSVKGILDELDGKTNLDNKITEEERKLMDSYSEKILEVYNRTGYVPAPLENRINKIVDEEWKKRLDALNTIINHNN